MNQYLVVQCGKIYIGTGATGADAVTTLMQQGYVNGEEEILVFLYAKA